MKTLHAVAALAAIGTAAFALGRSIGSPPSQTQTSDEVATPASFDLASAEATFTRATESFSALEQSELMSPLLASMGADDFDRLAPVVGRSDHLGIAALPARLFVERWAQLEPRAAYARVHDWPTDRQREVLPGLMRAWARLEPDAAVSALSSLETGTLVGKARTGLVQGWADANDASIWAYIATIEGGSARREAMVITLQKIAQRRGVRAPLREIEGLRGAFADDGFKTEAMGLALSSLARIDRDLALEEALACDAEPWCGEMALAVARRWANEDGRAACEWTRVLVDEEIRYGAMYAAFSTWARSNEQEARAWLVSQGGAADVGAGYAVLGRVLARRNLGVATRWAESVEQPELRREAMIAVGREYRHQDPKAAEAWLALHDLSEAIAARESRTAAAE